MKTIVHVITGLGTGGAEAMLYKLLERGSGTWRPHVITLRDDGVFSHYAGRIENLGITVESLGMRPGFPSALAVVRLARRLRVLRPDVAQTWMYHADLVGGVAARLAGVRAVAWGIMQSNLSAAVNSRATLAVVRACALLSGIVPARIISVSETGRATHIERGYRADRFRVLPVGFDLDVYRPDPTARTALRAELGLRPDTRIVGHVGRFDPQKNHIGLVRAFAEVRAVRTDAHLVLVGGGVDTANEVLTAEIDRLKLHGAVHLLGRREEVLSALQGFDVFASSSVGEGFPNVLGEAMACALPCAVTDVGDCAQVVGDTGKVVGVGDMRGLGRALLELLHLGDAERTALGQRARVRVEERYEIGAVVRRYEALYEELSQ